MTSRLRGVVVAIGRGAVARAVLQAGGELKELAWETLSLEEVYLQLTTEEKERG